MFCFPLQLMVHTVGCGFSRVNNIFHVVVDWQGYESNTRRVNLTCTMSTNDVVLAVHIIRT